MKKNILSVLCLIIACNTYAMSIEGGKLLNHSESVALNTKLSFKQSKINVQKVLKSKINLKAESTFSKFTNIMNTFGDVIVGDRGYTVITGNDYNNVEISNNTSEKKIYKITHQICAGPSNLPAVITCSSSINTVSVDPYNIIEDLTIPVLEITSLQPGQYDASIFVTIEDANNASLIQSYDLRSFTVPDQANKK